MIAWLRSFLGISSRKRKPFADLDQQWESPLGLTRPARGESLGSNSVKFDPLSLEDRSEDDTSLSDHELHERFLSCNSANELLDFLDDDLPDHHPLEGEVFAKALALSTNSQQDLKRLFEIAPARSDWERQAVERLLDTVTRLAEFQEFLDAYSFTDELRELIYSRILVFLESGLEKASTVDDCTTLYEEYCEVDPEFDGLTEKIIEKALSFCDSLEDCDRVIEVFYDDGPPDSDLEERVHLKRISFLGAVDDCSSIWEEFGVDSQLGESAICRAAEIILSREQQVVSEGDGISPES